MNDPNQTQGNGDRKRLTLDDPVSAEIMQAFRQIQNAQVELGLEMMQLEQRKIQLLASAKKLDEQHTRLFQAILVERGQPPQAPAELDGKTGRVVMLNNTPAPTPAPSTKQDTAQGASDQATS